MSGDRASLPLLLTLGEPAGISPELAAALWRRRDEFHLPPFAVVGDPAVLAARDSDLTMQTIEDPSGAAAVFPVALPVLSIPYGAVPLPGKPQEETAEGVIQAIRKAVEWVREDAARAIVTLPIQKQVLALAGFAFAGHTDFLAGLAGMESDAAVMMLVNRYMRVVPVTHHIALADVPHRISTELIVQTTRIVERELRARFGIGSPRLAVAGLNPHAGEGGRFGREELEIIGPAVEELSSDMDISGPVPPDSMFTEASRERFDAFICMYHDQALAPLKALDFKTGVNVTLGLPFVRTSPDHGTALDIAGKGLADVTSSLEALKLADRLSAERDG